MASSNRRTEPPSRASVPVAFHLDKEQWVRHFGHPFSASDDPTITPWFCRCLGVDDAKLEEIQAAVNEATAKVDGLSHGKVVSIDDPIYKEGFLSFFVPPVDAREAENIAEDLRISISKRIDGMALDFFWAAVESHARQNTVLRGFGSLGMKVHFHVGGSREQYRVRYYEQLLDGEGNGVGTSYVRVLGKKTELPERFEGWIPFNKDEEETN